MVLSTLFETDFTLFITEIVVLFSHQKLKYTSICQYIINHEHYQALLVPTCYYYIVTHWDAKCLPTLH